MTFISVAVPVPTLGLLTYRAADDVTPPAIGARVVVPLGPRTVTGIVVARDDRARGVADADIKPIRQVLDDQAFIPPDIVSLSLDEVVGKTRTLPIDSDLIRTARALGIAFGD